MTAGTPAPELSRVVAIDRIPAGGVDHVVEASAAECVAVAARLQIPAVHALSCVFHLTKGPDGHVLAEGRLRARITQVCVVSLDEFVSPVEERFRVRFVPEGTESDDPDPESDDEIPYAGGGIDLGEAAVEQLALGLDPYPRKPGAELPKEAGDGLESPFAALARFHRER